MTQEAALKLLEMVFGAAVVGAWMPPLVAVVVQTRWPSWLKAAVALASSIAVGTGTAWVAGELSGIGWPAAVVAAFLATQFTYAKYWRESGLAPWLEQLTNRKTIDGEATVTSERHL